MSFSAEIVRVLIQDPQGVACPTCGAAPLTPCRGGRIGKGMAVHARRTSAFFAEVVPVLRELEWRPFPEEETLAALEERRLAMRAAFCERRRSTDRVLAAHGLTPALINCVPCNTREEDR